MRFVRGVIFFLLLPIIILMNACSLVSQEQRDIAESGFLTAKVILTNPGAMSDYSGSVWVLPQYFPAVWPLDRIVGCRAVVFDSDPRISLSWDGPTLTIEHDRFVSQVTAQDRCYGRPIRLVERSA